MLNEITCDTPISAIIKMADFEKDLNNIQEILTDIEKEDKEILDNAMNNNLGAEAYSYDGKMDLYDYANVISKNINLTKSFNALKNQVTNAVLDQRKAEIECLKQKINDKILQLNAEYHSTISIIEEIKAAVNIDDNKVKQYLNTKNKLSESITHYEEKLKQVEALSYE